MTREYAVTQTPLAATGDTQTLKAPDDRNWYATSSHVAIGGSELRETSDHEQVVENCLVLVTVWVLDSEVV